VGTGEGNGRAAERPQQSPNDQQRCPKTDSPKSDDLPKNDDMTVPHAPLTLGVCSPAPPLLLRAFTYLAQGPAKRADQSPGRVGREVGYKPSPRTSYFFDGQLDPEVGARVAVVEGGHGPRHLGALRVVCRVVIPAIVNELLHPDESRRPARPSTNVPRACPGNERLHT
jgi:hypothetical protein